MSDRELIAALRRMKVETGSLACLGCGREHNCCVRGCAIVRAAAERLEDLTQEAKPRSVMEYGDGPR